MAVDTRNRRASVLGFARSGPLTLPAPDGMVGAADRAQVDYSYAGFASDPGGQVCADVGTRPRVTADCGTRPRVTADCGTRPRVTGDVGVREC